MMNNTPLKNLLYLAVSCVGVVLFLSSCGTDPKRGTAVATIESMRPNKVAPVNLEPARKDVGAVRESIVRADSHAEASGERIRALELDLLAAKGRTEKLHALARLLRESKSASKAQLEEFADKMKLQADEFERDRLRYLVAASNAKDDARKVRDELKKTAFRLSEVEKKLAAEQVKATNLKTALDAETTAANGYRDMYLAAKKDRDDAVKWRKNNQWKVNLHNWIFYGGIVYLVLRVVVLSTAWTPQGWLGKILRFLF